MQEEICRVMKEAYNRRWISMRDGNISVKDGNDLIVTPSGKIKYALRTRDLIKTRADRPNQSASIEFDMHRLIHEDAPDIGAVVHLHPTNVVAALMAGLDLQKICEVFPELHRYTRVGPSVDAFPPGSANLAIETAKAIKDNHIVGQVSHGVTAVGKDPWDAFEHIERLDHICEIALKGLSIINPNNVEYKISLDEKEKNDAK